MRKLILFLIRMHLGVKIGEGFTFEGQKSNNYYFFTDDALIKIWRNSGKTERSHVALNYILSEDCRVIKEPVV